MGNTYRENGIFHSDSGLSTSSVSSYTVDINPNAPMSVVYIEQAQVNDSGTVRLFARNSSGTSQNIRWRTWANNTTNSYSTTGSTFLTMNYWSAGNLNNSTYGTGETFRAKIFVYNQKFNTGAFATPAVYGSVNYEITNGYVYESRFVGHLTTNTNIHSLAFTHTNGNIARYRYDVWDWLD